MGVKGLWRLISPAGQTITMESLNGKVLAIDVSIWLNKAVKGMRDKHGNPIYNAHLVMVFNRLCNLLFYGVKPVFVFDGGVPELKKRIIKERRRLRMNTESSNTKLKDSMVKNYLQSKALEAVTGVKSNKTLKLPAEKEDLFNLPEIEEKQTQSSEGENEDSSWLEHINSEQLQKLLENPDQIDIDCEEFTQMPAEARHEVLLELQSVFRRRNKRKHSSETSLPEESGDFSNFQLKNLMKRGKITQQISDLRKEMNDNVSSQFLDEQFDYKNNQVQSKKLASSSSERYLLIKSTKSREANILFKSNIDDAYLRFDNKTDNTEKQKLRPINRIPARFETIEPNFIPDIVKDGSSSDSSSEHPDDRTVTITIPRKLANEKHKSEGESSSDDEFIDVSDPQTSLSSSESPLSKQKVHHIIEKKAPKSSSPMRDTISNTVSDKTPPKSTAPYQQINVMISEESDLDDAVELKPFQRFENTKDDREEKVQDNENLSIVNKSDRTEEKQDNLKSYDIEGEVKNLLPDNSNLTNSELSTEDLLQNKHNKLDSEIKFVKEFNMNRDLPESLGDQKGNLYKPDNNNIFDEDSTIWENKLEDNATLIDAELPQQQEDTADGDVNDSKEKEAFLQQFAADKKTEEELYEICEVLDSEREKMNADVVKKSRQAATLSSDVYGDVQALLHLFGVPYVVSPMEAEAQCAVLEAMNLTDGTITEDSDIFLFGANTVYRNVFDRNKLPQMYTQKALQNTLKLDRNKLIALAFLTGSDYTTGLQGVGGITGMEILHGFPNQKNAQDVLDKFRNWLEETSGMSINKTIDKIKENVRSVGLPVDFNSEEVWQAYLEPEVDHSDEKFEWGIPDVQAINEFVGGKITWSTTTINETLKPLLEKMKNAAKSSQSTLDGYFFPKLATEERKLSKRLQTCLDGGSPQKQNKRKHEDKTDNAKTAQTDGQQTEKKPKKKNAKIVQKKCDNLCKASSERKREIPPMIRIRNKSLTSVIEKRLGKSSKYKRAARGGCKRPTRNAQINALDVPKPLQSSDSD